MWTLGLVLVGVIILVILASLLYGWTSEARPTMRIDEIRTGDRIYTTYPGIGRYMFNTVGIQGGHAMMGVRDDNTGEAKLFDITGYRDMEEGEARPYLHPITDRTDDPDRKEFYTVWRYEGPRIPTKRIEEIAAKYKGNTFNYNFVGQHIKQRWLGAWRDTKPVLCCSELLYISLVDLGIIKWDDATWSDSFRYLQRNDLAHYSGPYDLVN